PARQPERAPADGSAPRSDAQADVATTTANRPAIDFEAALSFTTMDSLVSVWAEAQFRGAGR
ncbi:hypothetical protein NJ76_10780, partial [Rhodococcus sp. IITR03]